ncbi:O-antigen ligase family protein [Chitinivibrio alkaliphilus]|uniref:O-antigen ligase-related domain-containing protein n=1 Tax=Chitinivibrio alkaliphilus ACht1 TaxID=1313304 RepID=U7D6E6_9BACT|nr:O-antigen ligase family protein [Chitinivibrio alkaliphilus]ERP31508.1 hypothetical protein CALK_1552 [Chitinivibrio alkaliphilus ACht1]
MEKSSSRFDFFLRCLDVFTLRTLLFFYILISGAISMSLIPREIRMTFHMPVMGVAVFFYLIHLVQNRAVVPLTKYHVLMFAYLTIIFISLVVNRAPLSMIFWGMDYVSDVLIMGFIISLVLRKRDFNRIFSLLTIYALVSVFTGLFDIITGISLPLFRNSGLFADRNLAVRFYTFVSMYQFFTLIRAYENNRVRKRTILILLVILAHVILLMSRGGYAIYGMAMLAVTIISGNKRIFYIVLCILPVFLALVAIMTLQRIQQDRMDIVNYSDLTRVSLMRAGINMIEDNTLFGVGYRRFAELYFKYYDINLPTAQIVHVIHNIYIGMWAEIGIFGLMVYLMLNFGLIHHHLARIRRGYKAKDPHAVLGISLLIFMLHGIIYHSFDNDSSYWIILALSIIYYDPPLKKRVYQPPQKQGELRIHRA